MQKRLLLIAGLILVGSTHAAAPATAPLPPAVVGQIDGIVSSCTEFAPGQNEKFERLRVAVTNGMNSRDLEAMERIPAYRTSYKLIKDFFRTLTPQEARQVCKDLVK